MIAWFSEVNRTIKRSSPGYDSFEKLKLSAVNGRKVTFGKQNSRSADNNGSPGEEMGEESDSEDASVADMDLDGDDGEDDVPQTNTTTDSEEEITSKSDPILDVMPAHNVSI